MFEFAKIKEIGENYDMKTKKPLQNKKSVVESFEEEITIIKKVAIQSLFPAHLKYRGISGQEYEWQKAGDIVHVNEEDAPTLLSKRIGKSGCCGGQSGGNVLFQKA